MTTHKTVILGGGITGLAAGYASGLPVYEAADGPGGICSSYYVRPGESERLKHSPEDGNAYRFEIGGGHWIFGGDSTILNFIQRLTPVKSYRRRSSVFFHDENLYIPYPIQNFLRFLSPEECSRALAEIGRNPVCKALTMEEWLQDCFGETLCKLFFFPFHELYTAGLYKKIAPQDAYKSPVNFDLVVRGAIQDSPSVGYNTTFIYPEIGLNALAQRMAAQCNINYGKRVISISLEQKEINFTDGTVIPYKTVLSTLPLNQMIAMTGIMLGVPSDPYTSVLVLNIGAVKGARCPDDHWLYNTQTHSGFHRVGFYSNVDSSFLPQTAHSNADRVSIYVEKAFVGGNKPSEAEIQEYSNQVIQELQAWDFIKTVEVADPTWIEVAYTWTLPGSEWRQKAMQYLEESGIYPVGRYARWKFQGIADSIRDGFYSGTSFKAVRN